MRFGVNGFCGATQPREQDCTAVSAARGTGRGSGDGISVGASAPEHIEMGSSRIATRQKTPLETRGERERLRLG